MVDQLIQGGESIQASETAQGQGSYWITPGVYSLDSSITFSENNSYIRLLAGAEIRVNGGTGGLILDGDNITVEVGPGCIIDDNSSPSAFSITINGTGCCIKCKNGADLGNIQVNAAESTIDGGGWATILENVNYSIGSNDGSCSNASIDSKTENTIQHGITCRGSDNCSFNFLNIINSDANAFAVFAGGAFSAEKCCIVGCCVRACDFEPFILNSPDMKLVGNYIDAVVGIPLAAPGGVVSSFSNSNQGIWVGNYLKTDITSGSQFTVNSSLNRMILTDNVIPGGFTDSSSNLVDDNNMIIT
jgi:hypothetical protein